jgi:hypothetical protein
MTSRDALELARIDLSAFGAAASPHFEAPAHVRGGASCDAAGR